MRLLLVGLGLVCLARAVQAAPEREWAEPLTGMVFVPIPAGCVQLGTAGKLNLSPRLDIVMRLGFDGDLAADEKPLHEACFDAFWLARHEVREADWLAVMGGLRRSRNGAMPRTNVSWHEARAFADRLSQRHGLLFRLPSEAEWEYACRAGAAPDQEPVQPQLQTYAWFSSSGATMVDPSPVAALKPNAWGLYDMLGNVWEWVADGYQRHAYSRRTLFNPMEASGQTKVIRGASYRSEPVQVRCGNRGEYPAAEVLPQIGFRLLLVGLPSKRTGKP